MTTMNVLLALTGLGGFLLGAGVSNWRWLRVAEEEHWEKYQAAAYDTRELFDRADREHRLRLKVEAEAAAAVAEAKEWAGDLLVKVQRQRDVIRATHHRKARKVARLAVGWPGRIRARAAALWTAWPGGDVTRTAWEHWPVYGAPEVTRG